MRTHRFAKPSETRCIERGDYAIFDTPGFRGSRYGHRLDLTEPPWVRGLDHWCSIWRDEHGGKGIDLMYLVWELLDDTPQSELPEGGVLYRQLCLELGELVPPRANASAADYRPISGDQDWADLFQLNRAVHADDQADTDDYLRWANNAYRTHCEAGHGTWWAGFVEGQMVTAAGLFENPDEARFQDVGTHPDHRRQGHCSNLLARMLSTYRKARPDDPVYILVLAGDPAERLYRSLGFEPVTVLYELGLPPDFGVAT